MIKRKRAIGRGERKQLERERERAIGGRERVGRERESKSVHSHV
jgi:hypothetical protein